MISILALYDSPGDFSGHWVIREQRVIPGSGVIHMAPIAFVFRTLREALDFGERSNGYFLPSDPDEDDPVIVGSWLL